MTTNRNTGTGSGDGDRDDKGEGVEDGRATMVEPEPLSSTQQQRLVGFVPQFDVFLRSMTVFQLLTHSARTRLPAAMSG